MSANVAAIGHNNPPDPIDETLAPFADAIAEAENWLDGEPVTDEAGMNAVDALLKDIRQATTELGKAKKDATAPLHDAWKAEIARWKPTEDDLDRMKKGLAALVDPFKRKLAEEKEAAKRKAYEEAQRAEREAAAKAANADVSNIEAQREAEAAKQAALDAKKAASAANQDKVKGLRTVKVPQITDYKACVNWIASHDRPALVAFMDQYVARATREGVTGIHGVEVHTKREAF